MQRLGLMVGRVDRKLYNRYISRSGYSARGESMDMENSILQKRQALRDDIEKGRFRSLSVILLDGTSTFFQKISFSKKKVSFWLNAFIFILLTLLIAFLLTLPFDAPNIEISEESAFRITISGILGIILGSFFVITSALLYQKIMPVIKETVLDVIELPEHLDDLRTWLDATFNLRSQLLLGIILPIILFVPNLYLRNQITGENLGLPVYLVAVFAGFEAFSASSVLVASVALPYHLSQYQVKLFAADPSSSEVIDKLSGVINNTIFSAAILLTFFTIIAFVGNPSFVALNILIWPWLILVIVFVSGHRSLSKVVTQAKWRTLNVIQAQIETLQNSAEILDEDTLKQINQLLDYYNRIKSTHNSAVDVQAGLNLLQSLLFPLLGLVIANAVDILNFLSMLGTGK